MAIWTPSTKVKTKKIKEEGCTHIFEVEVPAPRVAEQLQTTLVRLQQKLRIPGFRQGKAPLDLIKRQYGQAASSEAAEGLIKAVIPDAIEELKLRPIAVPAVTKVDYQPEKPLKFEMHIEVAPQFEAKGYKGIAVTQKEYKVAEKDVEVRIKQLQESNARLEKAEEAEIGKDHYVVIDFELLRDGKPIDGGKGRQELIDMSSDQTIDGLSQGLLGAKPGESREFEVKIEDKPTVCKTTVVEIKKKVLPGLDDEFAKDLGMESLKKVQEEIRKIIEHENGDKSSREVSEQIEAALLKENPFQAPKSLTEHQLEHMMDRLRMRLVGPNKDLPKEQAEQLREKLHPSAEDHVRLQLILAEIARKENVQVTDEDFQGELERSLSRAKDEDDKRQTREFFERSKDDIRAAIRESKVIKLIRDSAKIKTVKG